ncbi:MAG: hypothetical protein ABSE90_09265 [Verrucomicrobiota bacterium]
MFTCKICCNGAKLFSLNKDFVKLVLVWFVVRVRYNKRSPSGVVLICINFVYGISGLPICFRDSDFKCRGDFDCFAFAVSGFQNARICEIFRRPLVQQFPSKLPSLNFRVGQGVRRLRHRANGEK